MPNDPEFANQWHLHNAGQSGGTIDADVDAVEAWEVTTGSMETVVAVLDDGVDDTHPDLYLNIWLNEGEIPIGIAAGLICQARGTQYWLSHVHILNFSAKRHACGEPMRTVNWCPAPMTAAAY